MGNPDYDWAFHLEPQEHAPNVNQIPWPRYNPSLQYMDTFSKLFCLAGKSWEAAPP